MFDAAMIAGPTASGKSAFALALAERMAASGRRPLIVNADSMQVYPVLKTLTAHPSEAELQASVHLLYGHVDPSKAYSAAQWLNDVRRVVLPRMKAGDVPIFTGGTGLYFRALEQGLDHVPPIRDDVRAEVRQALLELGPDVLHARLAHVDPVGAARLRAGDGQRVARALEVFESTGTPLHVHHEKGRAAAGRDGLFADRDVARWIVEPPRALLHERIAARAQAMMAGEAREEVRAFAALDIPPTATVHKAIGLRQILELERGERTIEDTVSSIISSTRQYAKRQSTWFRGQMGPQWRRVVSAQEGMRQG